MELDAVASLARELMDFHGLDSWSFRFDRAKRRAGKADFHRREISLSRILMELYPADAVRGVILHEIAHALVGPTHHHDATWRAACLAIGGDGKTTIDQAPQPPAKWIGTCPNGHTVDRFRRPSRPTSCLSCAPRYSEKYCFTWRRNDKVHA